MLTTATIQSYLGVSGDVAYLELLEQGVVADMETLTGLHLGETKTITDFGGRRPDPGRLTVPVRGRSIQKVRLSQVGVALGDVTVEERSSPTEAWSVVPKLTEDVPLREVFELEGIWLYRLIGEWPIGERTVKVTYSYGHDTEESFPATWRAVALDLIQARYQEPKMRKVGSRLTQVSIRGASMQLNGSVGAIPEDLRNRVLALRPAGGQ